MLKLIVSFTYFVLIYFNLVIYYIKGFWMFVILANIVDVICVFTVVLNDKQRVAKRRLIEDNRERRRQETMRMKIKHDNCYHEFLTDEDQSLIGDIMSAYELTAVKITKTYNIVSIVNVYFTWLELF